MKTAWGTLSITKFYIVLSKTSFKVLIQSRSFVSNFTNTCSDKVLAKDTFLLSTWQNKYESFICFFTAISFNNYNKSSVSFGSIPKFVSYFFNIVYR